MAPHRWADRPPCDAYHIARFSLGVLEYSAERPPHFRGFAWRRWIFKRWRFFRWRRFIGWRWRVGELVMNVSEQDQKRLSTAIRSAESKTSGEIVCVLAQSSSDTTALPILLAALVALALPWLLVAFTAFSVHRILLLQTTIFIALAVLLCVPRVRTALLPRAVRRAAAHRAATEQFF